MNIREATEEDFLAIHALMQELNPKDSVENTETRKSIYLSILGDSNNFIFAGVSNGIVVTTCYLNIIQNITWEAAPYALIENVVTSEAHRRNGYGRKCIQHAIDFAYSKGCFKVMLMSSQRNEYTREFYVSVGLVQSKDGYVTYKKWV